MTWMIRLPSALLWHRGHLKDTFPLSIHDSMTMVDKRGMVFLYCKPTYIKYMFRLISTITLCFLSLTELNHWTCSVLLGCCQTIEECLIMHHCTSLHVCTVPTSYSLNRYLGIISQIRHWSLLFQGKINWLLLKSCKIHAHSPATSFINHNY